MGSRSRGLLGLTIVTIVNVLVACSFGDDHSSETTPQSPESSAKSQSLSTSSLPEVNLSGVTTPSLHASEPEEAATSYMAMLMAGDYDGAATWVIPTQQGILHALALGNGDDTPPGISGQLEVGSVEATGKDTATVVFVGKMCREVPADGNGPLDNDCVINRDPQSKDPIFVIHLFETGDVGWKIAFQAPEVDK